MGKDYYDDMTERPSRRTEREPSSRPSRGLIWTIALGISICVVVIVVWYKFFPAQQVKSDTKEVIVQETRPQVEVISDAPQVQQPAASAEAPVINTVADAPVLDNQARSLADRPLVPSSSSKTVQYANHVVSDGEDLASIANLYSLKTQTLISVNQVRNIQAIKAGVTLKIPDRDGQLYTVREGDMLSTIARKYSPSLGWKTLQEVNGLKNENILVGQQLFIPDTSTSSMIQMADVAPIQFQKPTAGSITALFGQPMPDPATGITQPLNGILIVGQPGSAVQASASGEVVDAGYEVKGRGRFVVISHEGGYKTSYNHLENVEVKIGSSLSKGDIIGSIGTSGTDYDRPTLFFSIEQSGIVLDPSQFF